MILYLFLEYIIRVGDLEKYIYLHTIHIYNDNYLNDIYVIHELNFSNISKLLRNLEFHIYFHKCGFVNNHVKIVYDLMLIYIFFYSLQLNMFFRNNDPMNHISVDLYDHRYFNIFFFLFNKFQFHKINRIYDLLNIYSLLNDL